MAFIWSDFVAAVGILLALLTVFADGQSAELPKCKNIILKHLLNKKIHITCTKNSLFYRQTMCVPSHLRCMQEVDRHSARIR